MKFTFSIPYITAVQPQGFAMPVEVWADGSGGRMRVDTYDGANSLITTPDQELTIYPRITTKVRDH